MQVVTSKATPTRRRQGGGGQGAGLLPRTFFSAFTLAVLVVFALGVLLGVALFHRSPAAASITTQTTNRLRLGSSDSEVDEDSKTVVPIVKVVEQLLSKSYYNCLKRPLLEKLCTQLPSTEFSKVNSLMVGNYSLDGMKVTFSAWIWLDPNDTIRNMKTIVSNRLPGCDPHPRRNGYAFFVNEWKTNNRQLILMWGTERDGCVKIKTKEYFIMPGVWYHVGFILKEFGSDTFAAIYVDGKRVASTVDKATVLRSQRNHAQRWILRIPAASTTPIGFFIGAHPDLSFRFVGRIANVAVYKDEAVEALYWPGDEVPPFDRSPPPEKKSVLVAYYPLNSLNNETDLIKDESGHGLDALMLWPPNGSSIVESDVFENLAPFSPGFDLLIEIDQHKLLEGTFSDVVHKHLLYKSDVRGRERSQIVVDAMKHVWKNYEERCFGADELKPVSGEPNRAWGGIGMTLVDSLDTLWLMDMKVEFYRAVHWIEKSLHFHNLTSMVSVFETSIRVLGGLLSAYELSAEKILLQKAIELGDLLLPAFKSPAGIPRQVIHLGRGIAINPSWSGGSSVLSEFGSLQLEFRGLSFHSKNPVYAVAAEHIYDVVRNTTMKNGLPSTYLSPTSGQFTNDAITFGAFGDSYFEYLLKVWIQGGKKEVLLRELYDESIDALHNLLVQKTTPGGFTYIAEYTQDKLHHKMDHLACFVPGMLALGVYMEPSHPRAKKDMQLAKALMYTCYQLYARMPTGLSPELVDIVPHHDFRISDNFSYFLLRPEACESLFILHHVTKHPIYRDWGHAIMLAIEKHAKTKFGYGTHPDVRNVTKTPSDRMETFFMAETLKYLYLLQNPDHLVDLTTMIFNTEAHPTRIFPQGWRNVAKLENKSAFLFSSCPCKNKNKYKPIPR